MGYLASEGLVKIAAGNIIFLFFWLTKLMGYLASEGLVKIATGTNSE
jgi:hypothetical protein